jgi:tetratricopeptide (TPR) repeat protein
MTQNNLGNTLSESGIRTGGAEGQQLLAQAVAAYRAALEVRTKESLAPQWAQTHNNLAEASTALGDWEQVVTSYRNVLELYPDYQDAYLNTNSVLHEQLFRFADSLTLNRLWLATHSDDESAQMNFSESHLTTGRFGEAEQRFSELLNQPDILPENSVPLSLLRIVALVGQGQYPQVAEFLASLQASLAAQPEAFTLGRSFEGTKHFIGQHEAFATSREWLLALLAEFGGTTRDVMVTAVEAAQVQFVAADSPSRTLVQP